MMADIVVINKTISVPNVSNVLIDHETIGEGNRTALGAYRTDKVDRKRLWRITARLLTKTEYDAINDHLQNNLGGQTYFWIDDFGGDATNDSIEAVVEMTRDERIQFRSGGTFYNDGRNIQLEVIEV